MTTKQVSEAIEAWALTVIPEITSSYDYAADRKTQPLPDLAVEVGSVEVRDADDRFASQGFEQIMHRTRVVRLLVMVEQDPPDDATDALTEYMDRLQESIVDDDSLGNRVSWAARESTANFDPPFVEFDDGTRGRVATLEFAVGEPLEVND